MTSCDLCGAPKAPRACGLCERNVCKNCVRFLAQDQFRFHPHPPAYAVHGVFCADCFERDVEAEIARYNEVAERAETVKVVYDTFRGYIPCHKKAERTTEVADDAGRGIAVQRLKFLAAWEGFDAVIELDSKGEKKFDAGWQTKIWSATGRFANIDYKRFHPPE